LPQQDFAKVRYFKYNYEEKLNKSKSRKKRMSPSKKISPGTRMQCLNWGCGQQYDYSEEQQPGECQHHPGTYQAGSASKLWPEAWTCCGGDWQA